MIALLSLRRTLHSFFFFFNKPPPTKIYTFPLHDALPLPSADIVSMLEAFLGGIVARGKAHTGEKTMVDALTPAVDAAKKALDDGASLEQITSLAAAAARSEEHTSELQSQSNLVCRLLLEK